MKYDEINRKDAIEHKAKLVWGKDLHYKKSAPAHSPQLEAIFKDKWFDSLKGDLLEIGCGSGSDLEIFSKNKNIKSVTAIDLGENVKELKEIYKHRSDINIGNGNALSLEFDDESFDFIYSFGVFHHTSDPIKCIEEAKRVLKKNGVIFLYLYSSHEDLLFKRIGILFEQMIMNFFKFMPTKIQNLICILLGPICWLIFSVPSRILLFLGFKKLARKLPFYFGTHPFSIVEDLKDRLMSPVNHRFSKTNMVEILESINFSLFEIVKTSSGLYIYGKN